MPSHKSRQAVNNPIDQTDLITLTQDILAQAQQIGATAAEVSASIDLGYHVNIRNSEIDVVEYNRDKGVGITVYVGKRKGSASTSDISPAALRTTVEAAYNIAHYASEDPYNGLPDPELLAYQYPDLDLYFPWDLPVEQAIEMARECEALGRAKDKRINNSEGASVSTRRGYSVYGNSVGFLGAYPHSRHSVSCNLVAEENGIMETDSAYSTARDPAQLKSIPHIAERAATRTLRRLNSRKIKTCRVPVIFEAEIASGLLSHFLSSIRGGNLYRKSSFLVDHLGKQIFPTTFQMHEDPFIPKGLASSPFDGEGVKVQKRNIITDGVLQTYSLSSYSARKLGMQTTGNAGGTHNIFLNLNDLDITALLKKMGRGLFITEVMGQGVNIVTGDYSRGARGFWVDNGEMQYAVSEITIAGTLKDMFKNIIAIGNDITQNSSINTGSILVAEMMVAGE